MFKKILLLAVSGLLVVASGCVFQRNGEGNAALENSKLASGEQTLEDIEKNNYFQKKASEDYTFVLYSANAVKNEKTTCEGDRMGGSFNLAVVENGGRVVNKIEVGELLVTPAAMYLGEAKNEVFLASYGSCAKDLVHSFYLDKEGVLQRLLFSDFINNKFFAKLSSVMTTTDPHQLLYSEYDSDNAKWVKKIYLWDEGRAMYVLQEGEN